MNCLVIDCTTRWILCGLLSYDPGSATPTISGPELHREAPRESSTQLVLEIRRLIETAGSKPDWILCSLGPGSFTGIRIGVTTARNLAQLWNLPAAGLDTLTLYGSALARHRPQSFAIMLDGRQKRYYTKVITAPDATGISKQPIFDLHPEDYPQTAGLLPIFTDEPAHLKIPGVEVFPIPGDELSARSFLETALALGLPDPGRRWQELLPVYIRTDPAHAKYPAGFNHASQKT